MKASFLLTSVLVASLATALAAPVEYFDQSAFAANAGQLTTEGFDTVADGTVLSGVFNGFTISARRITAVSAAGVGLSDLNINSQPNGISAALYYSSPGVAAFDNGNDDFDFILATPASAAGLWIGNLGGHAGDLNATQVTFFDQQGTPIADESLNQAHAGVISSEHNNRIFYGIVSDVPIARVAIRNGAADQDAIILDDFQFVPRQSNCQAGSVFANVALPEIFIPLDRSDKKCPAQIRLAPLGLNFTVQSTTELGALCEAKSNVGTLTMLLVCPDGRERFEAFSTAEATLTLFQDGTLRWHVSGFEVVTAGIDYAPRLCNFGAITDSINIISDLGLDPTITPFELIVRVAEPVFHRRLSVIVETSSCLETWLGKQLKKVAKKKCGC